MADPVREPETTALAPITDDRIQRALLDANERTVRKTLTYQACDLIQRVRERAEGEPDSDVAAKLYKVELDTIKMLQAFLAPSAKGPKQANLYATEIRERLRSVKERTPPHAQKVS